MVCIRLCPKCKTHHRVGGECQKPVSLEERRRETQEFLRKLDQAEKASKRSTLRFGTPSDTNSGDIGGEG